MSAASDQTQAAAAAPQPTGGVGSSPGTTSRKLLVIRRSSSRATHTAVQPTDHGSVAAAAAAASTPEAHDSPRPARPAAPEPTRLVGEDDLDDGVLAAVVAAAPAAPAVPSAVAPAPHGGLMTTAAAMALVGNRAPVPASATRVISAPNRRSLGRLASLERKRSPTSTPFGMSPLVLPDETPTSLGTILSPPLRQPAWSSPHGQPPLRPPTWAMPSTIAVLPTEPTAGGGGGVGGTTRPPSSPITPFPLSTAVSPTRSGLPSPKRSGPLKIVVPASSNPRSSLPAGSNHGASTAAGPVRYAFPVFKPDGDLDVRYVNQQHVMRKRLIAKYLLIFAAVFVALEIPYMLHSNWSGSRDYVPIVIRCAVAVLIYLAVRVNHRLYVARFMTHTTERFDALVSFLMLSACAVLCAAETQRREVTMDSVLDDGLLLGLTLVYAFAGGVARIRWFFLVLVGAGGMIAYIVSLRVSDLRTTRYLLMSLSHQLLVLVSLVAAGISAEKSKAVTVENQKLQFLERKKAEQLLRSMLPVRILSDYLDGSIGQLQANATIGFVQMHLGQLVEKGPPGSHQAASPQAIASPGELMQKLHDTFKRIDGIVAMYAIRGINKVETVASTYLLCAGLLQDIDDHAAAMVDVSLEIMAMVTTRLNMGSATGAKKRIPVLLRIGISSGPVVGGIIGAQRRFFRVFGDTVNVAARMCTNVTMGCIQLSPSCYGALSERQRAAYKVADGVELDIKGKGRMTCYRVESRADWVPKFGKMAMNRGQARDEPLLHKSFVYHKLLARTDLGPLDLLFKQEHGAGHLEKQATFVRAARQTNTPVPPALQASPSLLSRVGARVASARDLLSGGSGGGDEHHSHPHPSNGVESAVVAMVPFRTASASRTRITASSIALRTSGAGVASQSRLTAGPSSSANASKAGAPSSDSPKQREDASPYATVSIERFFQLNYARTHLFGIRAGAALFALFCLGVLIYLAKTHPPSGTSSINSVGPIAMIASLLAAFGVFVLASVAENACTRLAACEPCADASLNGDSEQDQLQQQPAPPSTAGGSNNNSSDGSVSGLEVSGLNGPSHFMRHLQSYLLIFCALGHIWILVALDMWGVAADGVREISPVFALQLLTIYSCFLLRLQFRLLAPLEVAAWLTFAAQMIAYRASYVHLLLVLSHLLVGVVIGLGVVYSVEWHARGTFLLAYALEKEQESMDLFLNNLLPKDVVLVLKKQNPALAREVVRSSGGAAVADRANGVRSMSLGSEGGVSSRFAMHFPRTTVFESDIVGYTEMVSHLSPSDTLNLLNLVFSRFDQAAHECGVEKIETIGDAFMCMVFDGAPDPVLDFALTVVDALQACSKETHPRQDLQVRMGIATGSCFGGIVGTEIPRFHLFGSAHDVAIHIEQSGRAGAIIVSSATYALSAARYEYEPLDLRVDEIDTFLLKAKRPEMEDDETLWAAGDAYSYVSPTTQRQPPTTHFVSITSEEQQQVVAPRARTPTDASAIALASRRSTQTVAAPSSSSMIRSINDVPPSSGVSTSGLAVIDSPAERTGSTARTRSLVTIEDSTASSTGSTDGTLNRARSLVASTTSHRPTPSGSCVGVGSGSNSGAGSSGNPPSMRGSGSAANGTVFIHTSLSAVASSPTPTAADQQDDLIISHQQFIDPTQIV